MNKPTSFLQMVLCLLLCWLSVACIDETRSGSSGGEGAAPAGNLLLTLQVPGISEPESTATRTVSPADECRVDPAKLHLLLFDQSGDKYVFYRYAAPTNLREVEGSHPRRYTVDVPFKAGEFNRNYRIMLIANLPLEKLKAAGGGEDFPAFKACSDRNNPVEAVRNLIACDNPGNVQTGRWPAGGAAKGFTPFPMWGESTAFNARPQGNIGTLSLIRAVARIDVGINFRKNADGTYPLEDMRSQGVGNAGNAKYFKLMSVSVYRIPRSAWVGPRDANYDAQAGMVTAATPTGDVVDAPRRYIEEDLSTDPDAAAGSEAENRRALTRTVYVPEAANHGHNRDQAACLVIGGVYGTGNPTTYYRIDIYDRTPGADGNMPRPTPENRLDILRNHTYVVNITSVYAPGASTETDALQADNTNMEVELSDWNQGPSTGDITTDGVYSLNLSKSEQEYYSDGSPVDFTIETNYDGELGKGWQMETDDVAKQFVMFYDKTGNEITYGSPDWPAQGKNGTTNLRIGWKEFEQPTGTTVVQARQAMLTFTAGRMKVRCKLRQLSREMLRINFTPAEMYFSREPESPQHIGIGVTTRKSYRLEVSWRNEAGTNCTWNLTDRTANPGTCPDNRFLAGNFFVPDPSGGYLLKPEALPAERTTPRTFLFTFTATSLANGTTGTNLLTVYQSNQNINWKVDGGAGSYGNEVFAANDAPNVSARIVTTPGSLIWYFSRSQDMGKGEWITNLDAIIGTKQTGGGMHTFNLQPNTKLGRRSYTLQARSTEGLDENSSRLVLTQFGTPLVLKPSLQGAPGRVTEATGSDGKNLYTLDYGPATDANAMQKIDMTSNTDWFWRWDRSSPTFQKEFKDMFGTAFTANPAEDEATADGSPDGSTPKIWAGVFTFSTTDQRLKTEAELAADPGNVPLGGVRGITMDLRNKNVELEEEDVEANRRRFRIQRAFPSYQNIVQWPYQENENLDMHADEIMAGTEPPFTVRTNAIGTVECFSGVDMNNMSLMGRREVAAYGGYNEFRVALRDLRVPVNATSWMLPKTWVKLKYTGPRREVAGNAGDNPTWSEEKKYFYGAEVNIPLRNMATGQKLLSPATHNLILDFSNSAYKKLKVRIRLETVNTSLDKRGFAGTIQDKFIDAIGGVNGTELTWPNTRISFTLPPAQYENTLTRVWCEYYAANQQGGGDWKSDRSPIIYQDGLQKQPYLVLYDNYPESVNNGTWTENPIGKRTYQFTDAAGATWYAASIMQPEGLLNEPNATTAFNFAKRNKTTICNGSLVSTIHINYEMPIIKYIISCTYYLNTFKPTFRCLRTMSYGPVERSFVSTSNRGYFTRKDAKIFGTYHPKMNAKSAKVMKTDEGNTTIPYWVTPGYGPTVGWENENDPWKPGNYPHGRLEADEWNPNLARKLGWGDTKPSDFNEPWGVQISDDEFYGACGLNTDCRDWTPGSKVFDAACTFTPETPSYVKLVAIGETNKEPFGVRVTTTATTTGDTTYPQ